MEPVALLGSQRPQRMSLPPYVSTSGPEALELCESASLYLDSWQAFYLAEMLGEREDGKWSAPECGLVVPRQQGKTELLVARMLVSLFLLDEGTLLCSAHLFKTSQDTFRRLRGYIESTPDLARKVAIRTTNGDESVTTKDGKHSVRFVARTRGGGRGLSAGCILLDEAFNLSDQEMASLLPTISAQENPQVVYTSSPSLNVVDGAFLLRLKARGEAGSKGLLWADWGCPPGTSPDDRAAWAASNPGLGIRLNIEAVEREREAMKPEDFLRERLGVWPSMAGNAVISAELWSSLVDRTAERSSEVVFSVEVSPDRQTSSIVSAGLLPDGRVLLSVVDSRPGTNWLEQRCKTLSERWNPLAFVIDSRSPASSLIPLGLTVADRKKPRRGELILMATGDVTSAYGQFIDAVNDRTLVHLDEAPLNVAVANGQRRDIGDSGSAWGRRKSGQDITPLVAATSAHWALTSLKDELTKVLAPSAFYI